VQNTSDSFLSNMSDGDCLFRAAQRGDLDASRQFLQQLLHKGAPLSVFASAMDVAIWNDYADVVGEIACLAGHMWMGGPARYNTCARHLVSAARRDSPAAARVLLRYCTGAISWYNLETALDCAVLDDNAATLALMIPWASIESRASQLLTAAANGRSRAVRTLVGHGVHADTRDGWSKWTALHFAAMRGQTQVVKQLLWCKADICAPTKEGSTALDLATAAGHVATANALRRFAAQRVNNPKQATHTTGSSQQPEASGTFRCVNNRLVESRISEPER